ncbi:MAG TPA: hypothetical protein VLX31_17850 [Streptosporangiaceae bacterium]|nr:hypothetical protein [Streptosporangiaceae bacterium]
MTDIGRLRQPPAQPAGEADVLAAVGVDDGDEDEDGAPEHAARPIAASAVTAVTARRRVRVPTGQAG